MNVPQRLVLVIGSILLFAVMSSTESHREYRHQELNMVWDWQAAAVRAAIVCAVTTGIFLAVVKKR